MIAMGFSAIATDSRNKKIENAQAGGGLRQDVSAMKGEPVLKEESI